MTKKKSLAQFRAARRAAHPNVVLMIIIPHKPGVVDDRAAGVVEKAGEPSKPVFH